MDIVNRIHSFLRTQGLILLVAALVFAALYLISRFNYLLFHTLVEIFGILIAGTIFVLAWNARHYMENGYLVFLGIGLLCVGGIALLHTLAYRGMGVFPLDANLPTQLWLANRFLLGISLVFAPFFVKRKLHSFRQLAPVILGFALAFPLLLLSIFVWKIFPVAFIEGQGLTPFKIVSEYVIILLFLIGGSLLLRRHEHFDPDILRLLLSSLLFNITAEFIFTTYIKVDDIRNLVGHFFQVVAFYLIYKAVIETGFLMPQRLMFRELAEANANLQVREVELMESEHRYRRLFETLTEGFALQEALYDRNRQIEDFYLVEFNPAFEAIAGLAHDHPAGRTLRETMPDMVASWMPRFIEVVRSGESICFEDQNPRTGSYYELKAYCPAPGRCAVLIGDITERQRGQDALRQSEARLASYALQLEQSNRELEEFAFVASHDLQEPLRKIQAFGERLKKQIGDSLGEEETLYFERMLAAAARMRSMITDLLALSRITTHGRPFEWVNLSEVAQEVVSDLEIRINASGGQVTLGDLPRIEADPIQMHQLLQNLIGNAVKFHAADCPPLVIVCSEPQDQSDQVKIYVKDQGIGFDEQYLNRIFQPFQRLHGLGSYEGSGIGLAICRKIVERHSGTITASSQPGKGATFIITLPVKRLSASF